MCFFREKYWLLNIEPKLNVGTNKVSLEAGKAQQSLLPETKAKIEANVLQQLVMLHPVVRMRCRTAVQPHL